MNREECSVAGIKTQVGRVGEWAKIMRRGVGICTCLSEGTLGGGVPVVVKVERRLEGWKKALLGSGIRVSSSLPISYAYLFQIPGMWNRRLRE